MIPILQQSEKFAKQEYAKHDKQHQWGHVEAVMNIALKLANYYPETDLEILKLAILFHDIFYENYETHVEKSIDVAKNFLLKHGYPTNRMQLVLDVMIAHSGPHRKNFGDTDMIEGKIIYDADKLRLATTPEGFSKYSSRFYLDETKDILKTMKNKAFIFDWSGTLSDNFHLFGKVCDLMFAELGKKPISSEEIKLNFTLPYMKFWNRYFPNLSKEKQCKLYEKYIHSVGEPKLYKHVKEIIVYLKNKGYELFILSSDPISKLLPEIKKSGFTELITKTVGNVHEKKDVVASFIDDFSLDKNITYYVGDTSGDVEAGQNAGVKTIGISWGFQHKNVMAKAKPDFIINDIIKIKEIIF